MNAPNSSSSPRLVSIQVGRPTTYGREDAADPMDQVWTTAFWKAPIDGSVAIGPMGVEGDGQADRVNHGGVDKAILAYSLDHYALWANELASHRLPTPLPPGAFGENLTIAGQTEADVCIGDTWGIGDAVVQVTQPRQPCWKLARRWRIADLAAQVVANGRCGWYLRVLASGVIVAPAELRLIARPRPDWTIARAAELMHHRKQDVAGAAELAAVPELSQAWRQTLRKRAGV